MAVPVATSQRRTVWSQLPLAIVRPSGLKATEATSRSCPMRVAGRASDVAAPRVAVAGRGDTTALIAVGVRSARAVGAGPVTVATTVRGGLGTAVTAATVVAAAVGRGVGGGLTGDGVGVVPHAVSANSAKDERRSVRRGSDGVKEPSSLEHVVCRSLRRPRKPSARIGAVASAATSHHRLPWKARTAAHFSLRGGTFLAPRAL